MKENSNGMYYPTGEYKSRTQIQQKFGETPIIEPIVTPDRTFDEWTDHLSYIQQKRKEILPFTKKVDVRFTDGLPKFIGLIGDAHIGADCDYDLLRRDVSAIEKTDGAYVLLLGDLVDGYFFGEGATQDALVSLSEEGHYAKALMDHLNGKILAAWKGDHDGWADKGGLSIYQDFKQRYNTHLLHGIAYVDIHMGDTIVKMAGAHRHAGSSIYAKTAAAQRLHRESAGDCHVVFTGHNHTKGLVHQSVPTSEGSRKTIFATVGPYKRTDSWLRKQGYPQQDGHDLGGIGLIIYPDGNVEGHYSISEGAERFINL